MQEATDGKVTQKKLVVPVSGGRVHTDMASMSLPLMNSANNVRSTHRARTGAQLPEGFPGTTWLPTQHAL